MNAQKHKWNIFHKLVFEQVVSALKLGCFFTFNAWWLVRNYLQYSINVYIAELKQIDHWNSQAHLSQCPGTRQMARGCHPCRGPRRRRWDGCRGRGWCSAGWTWRRPACRPPSWRSSTPPSGRRCTARTVSSGATLWTLLLKWRQFNSQIGSSLTIKWWSWGIYFSHVFSKYFYKRSFLRGIWLATGHVSCLILATLLANKTLNCENLSAFEKNLCRWHFKKSTLSHMILEWHKPKWFKNLLLQSQVSLHVFRFMKAVKNLHAYTYSFCTHNGPRPSDY